MERGFEGRHVLVSRQGPQGVYNFSSLSLKRPCTCILEVWATRLVEGNLSTKDSCQSAGGIDIIPTLDDLRYRRSLTFGGCSHDGSSTSAGRS